MGKISKVEDQIKTLLLERHDINLRCSELVEILKESIPDDTESEIETWQKHADELDSLEEKSTELSAIIDKLMLKRSHLKYNLQCPEAIPTEE